VGGLLHFRQLYAASSPTMSTAKSDLSFPHILLPVRNLASYSFIQHASVDFWLFTDAHAHWAQRYYTSGQDREDAPRCFSPIFTARGQQGAADDQNTSARPLKTVKKERKYPLQPLVFRERNSDVVLLLGLNLGLNFEKKVLGPTSCWSPK